LLLGSKSVLVEQSQFSVTCTQLCEVRQHPSDRRDQIRLPLHKLFVGHKCHENNWF
jgi:hypothetical protein